MLLLQFFYDSLKGHFSLAGTDPRTKNLPLVSSYTNIIIMLVTYVLVTKQIGPRLMAKSEPFKLKGLIKFYNFAQILLNLYIFIGFITAYWSHPKYNWTCMARDKTDFSPDTMRLLSVCYICFLSKLVDLLDTVFFVLRKKYNQISFLHVYHHASMVWGSFVYLNLFMGSTFTTIGFVNSLVHVLMYTYYLVSALDVKINLDKWKPRMTQIQIIQFCYFSIKIGYTMVNNTCGLPLFWLNLVFIQNLFIAAMFSNFYYKTYMLKQKKIKRT